MFQIKLILMLDGDKSGRRRMQFLNDDFICWGKEAIQPYLTLYAKVINPLVTKSTNSQNCIDNWVQVH